MNPELSRRVALAMNRKPLTSANMEIRRALADATAKAKTFDDLPDKLRSLIRQTEEKSAA